MTTAAKLVAWDESGHEHEEDLARVDLDDLVARLDGRSRTLVTVYAFEGHGACGDDAVSGVVMYATFDGLHFFQLADSDAPSQDRRQVVAGGQPGWYDRRFVVPAQLATAALHWFVEHSALMPGAVWIES